jgi:hypothetical protein
LFFDDTVDLLLFRSSFAIPFTSLLDLDAYDNGGKPAPGGRTCGGDGDSEIAIVTDDGGGDDGGRGGAGDGVPRLARTAVEIWLSLSVELALLMVSFSLPSLKQEKNPLALDRKLLGDITLSVLSKSKSVKPGLFDRAPSKDNLRLLPFNPSSKQGNSVRRLLLLLMIERVKFDFPITRRNIQTLLMYNSTNSQTSYTF